MLRNRPLLISMLAVFTAGQFWFGQELFATGFDWRPLVAAPIVKVAMLDFTFTAIWCTLWLFDESKRQRRNPWAWLPLLLILPTGAMFLFSLTSPQNSAAADR